MMKLLISFILVIVVVTCLGEHTGDNHSRSASKVPKYQERNKPEHRHKNWDSHSEIGEQNSKQHKRIDERLKDTSDGAINDYKRDQVGERRAVVKHERTPRDLEGEQENAKSRDDKRVVIQYLPAFTTPPDPNKTLLMARYIVHTVDWAALATTTKRGIGGPFANVVSMSDGPENNGTGVPYFYVTPMDLSTQDITKDNRASVVFTLAQTDYCRTHIPSSLDPEDPRCARLILSGKMKRVKPDSPEYEFARDALFSRHPVMKTWPSDHGFFISKLKIGEIILLDQFGGPEYLNVKDYLKPKDD